MIQRISGKEIFPFSKHPLLFGHRGCSKAAPENTIAAFQGILDNDIPGVELDIHACKSGELVVIHDFNTKRTTGVDAVVEETSLDKLKKLDAGSFFSEDFNGERIPTLDEVLDLMGEKVYYDIEIKQRSKKPGILEEAVIKKLREYHLNDRVIISSFNPFTVKRVKIIDPDIPTALIYAVHPAVPFLLRRGGGKYIAKPDILKPEKLQVSEKLIKNQQIKNKYGIITWIEDDIEKAKRFLAMGVNGIVSNQPEVLKKTVEEFY